MSSFHGKDKRKNYFEGWYFKHQNADNTIAFIPGINIDSLGNKSAFIQVITNKSSYNINYPFSKFATNVDKLSVKVGDNIFSSEGIEIHIKEDNLNIEGNIEYGELTPIKYDIMGPFSVIPFMECNHGIISMKHELRGQLTINGEVLNLHHGIGYIERDWGISFPESYLWTQCNDFKGEECSIMASIADIPFGGINFKGCICVVYYKGCQYRLATYNGVKIVEYDSRTLILKRGKLKLHIELTNENPQKLLAPNKGHMSRIIHENAACTARFRFYIKGRLVFDVNSNNCSFEYVDKQSSLRIM